MSTHALGAGTCNLCVNVRTTDRKTLGRLAYSWDMSLGALVRNALARIPTITRDAAKSELYDIQAERLLRHVLADPRIPKADRDEIASAASLIHKSAAADHEISSSFVSAAR